jgi:hypothetical protein
MNIPVIQEMKMGYNLMDLLSFTGIIFTVNQSVSVISSSLFQNGEHLIEYFAYREGSSCNSRYC